MTAWHDVIRDGRRLPAEGLPDVVPVHHTSTASGSDRRRWRRLRVRYPVVFHRRGESTGAKATTTDISSGGFFCISTEPFVPYEKLECELTVPGEVVGKSPEDRVILHFEAEVVRVIADGLKPGYGIACRLGSCALGFVLN